MGLLKLRVVVLLSLVYLSLVVYLYHYLRKSDSWESSLSFLELKPNPVPHGRHLLRPDAVEFNFKRVNPFLQHQNETSKIVINQSTSVRGESQTRATEVPVTRTTVEDAVKLPVPNTCVHAFYYMWYGTEERDGKFYHWNHRYLPHWDKWITNKYPKGRHKPPHDVGASFYPELGCYSSTDPKIMNAHMRQLKTAGVGVAAVSWYPLGLSDDEGFPPDPLIPNLLDSAHAHSVQVAFHIEPYKERTPLTVKNDLVYIVEKYGSHPAFYRRNKTDSHGSTRRLPLVYVYDSYLSTPDSWARVLGPDGPESIRGTSHDSVVLGLVVQKTHQQDILAGGFDGFYTYFASKGFSYGSTPQNWPRLASFAKTNGLLFVPSVGPGYDDVRVRPWNSHNTKPRQGGKYYLEMFRAAVEEQPGLVSITSFNEWHEGTQIEPSVPKNTATFTYKDFSPNSPDFYLHLTLQFARQMRCTL